LLASLVLPDHLSEVETFLVRAIRFVYEPVLHWSLSHVKTMTLIGLGFLAATGFIGSRLGSEFLPHLEEGNLWIRVQLPPSTGLVSGTPATGKLREIMMRHPEILTVVSQHGRPETAAMPHRSPMSSCSPRSSRSTSGRQG
jgi:heavy metal efflux system protein